MTDVDRKPDPQLAGATEAFVHERASATSKKATLEEIGGARSVAKAATPPTRKPALAASLRQLQQWFAASVMHPRALEDGVTAHRLLERADDLERIVTASDRLSALQRLGVYHHGYHARLVEVLGDDYPAMKYAIGDDAFESLGRRYVEAHPSRSPSLNFFGRHMASFLRDENGAHGVEAIDAHRGFLADLAALEWAMVEVLHAAPAPTLSLETLSAIPPQKWASAKLPAADTVRLLHFAHPANPFFQAWKTDKSPTIPEAKPSATIVYRQDLILWRLELTPPMTRLLESLFAGDTLGDALARIETPDSLERDAQAMAEVQRNVMVWFRTWVAGGVFARIDVPDE
jgi:hypothetical protein